MVLNKSNTSSDISVLKPRKYQIVWRNVVMLSYLHIAAIYGFYLLFSGHSKVYTFLWGILCGLLSTMGVAAGAHKLWSHNSYKANLPLRIVLASLMTMTFQNSIYEWCRDHRMHHKYSETDADPHNAKRGFFFAHVGWLMVKKHPDLIEKGKLIELSDLKEDGVVMFQKKYYAPLVIFGTFIMPTLIPYYTSNETLWNAYHTCALVAYILSLNLIWCINSVAHIFGNRPYDRNNGSSQNGFMIYCALGEGYHNYHHTFPYDYRSSEFGNNFRNLTAYFIEAFAKINWATDLQTVSPDLIKMRALRTGDGTWKPYGKFTS